MDKIYCGQIITTKGVYRQFGLLRKTKCNPEGKLRPDRYFDFFSNKRSFLFPIYCGKVPQYITGGILDIDEHLRDFMAKNYNKQGQFLHVRKGG